MNIKQQEGILKKIKWAIYLFAALSGFMCLWTILVAKDHNNLGLGTWGLISSVSQQIFTSWSIIFSIVEVLYWGAYIAIVVFFVQWISSLERD